MLSSVREWEYCTAWEGGFTRGERGRRRDSSSSEGIRGSTAWQSVPQSFINNIGGKYQPASKHFCSFLFCFISYHFFSFLLLLAPIVPVAQPVQPWCLHQLLKSFIGDALVRGGSHTSSHWGALAVGGAHSFSDDYTPTRGESYVLTVCPVLLSYTLSDLPVSSLCKTLYFHSVPRAQAKSTWLLM